MKATLMGIFSYCGYSEKKIALEKNNKLRCHKNKFVGALL